MVRHNRTQQATCRYCDQTEDECTCAREIVSVHTLLDEIRARGMHIEETDYADEWVRLDVAMPLQHWDRHNA